MTRNEEKKREYMREYNKLKKKTSEPKPQLTPDELKEKRRISNKLSYEKHKEERTVRARLRYQNDPEYRDRVLKRQRDKYFRQMSEVYAEREEPVDVLDLALTARDREWREDKEHLKKGFLMRLIRKPHIKQKYKKTGK